MGANSESRGSQWCLPNKPLPLATQHPFSLLLLNSAPILLWMNNLPLILVLETLLVLSQTPISMSGFNSLMGLSSEGLGGLTSRRPLKHKEAVQSSKGVKKV